MHIAVTPEPRLEGPLTILEFEAPKAVMEEIVEWLDEAAGRYELERVSAPAGTCKSPHEILTRLFEGVHRYRLSLPSLPIAVMFKLRWSEWVTAVEAAPLD
ncbi:hypothetical protein Q0812_10225 [Brevundimonas sp. 2R-24]|uniref:Uncharacterized protein n=1 Tax=Peiella sedimenti TaxID=3061083 RepID=A0ABT8SN63_9CAUL|nr:hypothetical protein [Caulobacteraceae bacterium XZ-24]